MIFRIILISLVVLTLESYVWGSSVDPYVISTIAYESSGEPLKAQVWVAGVIQTRMKERKLSALEVVKQKWQFSCNNPGERQKMKPRTTKELKKAFQAWQSAKKLNIPANLYHDISVLPYWAKSEKVTFLIQIGNLRFYQE